MMRWISVKNRLPKDNLVLVHVVTADKKKPLITLAWHEKKFGWSLIHEVWIPCITHWMPLPKPPKTARKTKGKVKVPKSNPNRS